MQSVYAAAYAWSLTPADRLVYLQASTFFGLCFHWSFPAPIERRLFGLQKWCTQKWVFTKDSSSGISSFPSYASVLSLWCFSEQFYMHHSLSPKWMKMKLLVHSLLVFVRKKKKKKHSKTIKSSVQIWVLIIYISLIFLKYVVLLLDKYKPFECLCVYSPSHDTALFCCQNPLWFIVPTAWMICFLMMFPDDLSHVQNIFRGFL